MPSLQDQLAISMANRRQRLRYVRRHQMKLATPQMSVPRPLEQKPEARAPKRGGRRLLAILEDSNDETAAGDSSSKTRKKLLDIHPAQKVLPWRYTVRSETKASRFNPTPSAIARLQRDERGSVVSSSRNSTTFLAEELEGFPDPPKVDAAKGPPSCPFCGKYLEESELEIGKWRYV